MLLQIQVDQGIFVANLCTVNRALVDLSSSSSNFLAQDLPSVMEIR